MLTGHATCSVTSRHSYASKSQDTTVKSVQAFISYGTCNSMFTTNIAHGVRGYHSKCSDEMVIVRRLKFLSDPFGASRATWFVFAFFPCFVYCLLYIVVFNLLIFCRVLQFLLFLFLLVPFSCDRVGANCEGCCFSFVVCCFLFFSYFSAFSRYSFLLRFGLYC